MDLWQRFISALERILMLPSFIQAIFPSLGGPKRMRDVVRACDRSLDDFRTEVQRLFQAPLNSKSLLAMSAKLQEQFLPKLQASNICMLPSYNHTLPTGHEKGTYLALDVGGSTFRIALVELKGKIVDGESMHITHMRSYPIDNAIRCLKGRAFFDWMAANIDEAISGPEGKSWNNGSTLPMGLAWSFPVEYAYYRRAFLGRIVNVLQTNVNTKWHAPQHGQRLPCDRRHSGARSRRADHDIVSRTGNSTATPEKYTS
jgi:hexokinase